MVEETPSRMSVGAYRLLSDNDEELMDLSPVVLLRDENNVTIDDDYSRKVALRHHDNNNNNNSSSRHQSYLQAIMDGDNYDNNNCDYNNMHFEFAHVVPAELNGLNYLNAMTVVIHLFVSVGIGLWGLDGIMARHWDVTQDYPTLVTPAKWTYCVMWTSILCLETIFGFAQLLPSFRSRPLIQDATGFFFFYVCLLQTAWILCFSFRVFIASFVLAVLLFVALVSMLIRQYSCQMSSSPSPSSSSDKIMHWLFTFPFRLHCGWMAAMVVVNLGMMIRTTLASLGVASQLAIHVTALCALLPFATVLLWSGYDRMMTDFCIPSVIACYYIGVAERLRRDPGQGLLVDYGETIVVSVQLMCYIMAGMVAALFIPRLLISMGHRFLRIQVVTFMQEDSLTLE